MDLIAAAEYGSSSDSSSEEEEANTEYSNEKDDNPRMNRNNTVTITDTATDTATATATVDEENVNHTGSNNSNPPHLETLTKTVTARAINPTPMPSYALILRDSVEQDKQEQESLPLVQGHQKQQLVLTNNPLKSVLYRPVQGPVCEDPYDSGRTDLAKGVAGRRTAVHFDEFAFARERIAMEKNGEARAPDADGSFVSSVAIDSQEDFLIKNAGRKRKLEILEAERKEKVKLLESEDPDEDEANYGIWGPPSKAEKEWEEDLVTDAQAGTITEKQVEERDYRDEMLRRRGEREGKEAEQFDRLVERKVSHLLPPRLKEDQEAIEPTTKFHGREETDYRGRSWIEAPPGVKPDWEGDHDCYAPKKCVHKFTGHNKGVQRIRFFPGTGHLLLSAGLDGKCKIWSMYGTRQCMRTYIGHSAAVRDIQFNNNGTKFLSASFDRYIRLWDTESGKVLNTFSNRRVPYVIKFYPKDDNLFVTGMSDNKVVTFDATTGKITQECKLCCCIDKLL